MPLHRNVRQMDCNSLPIDRLLSVFCRAISQQKSMFCQLSHVESSVVSLLNAYSSSLPPPLSFLGQISNSFVSDVYVTAYNTKNNIFYIFNFPPGYLDIICSVQNNQCVTVYMLMKITNM